MEIANTTEPGNHPTFKAFWAMKTETYLDHLKTHVNSNTNKHLHLKEELYKTYIYIYSVYI